MPASILHNNGRLRAFDDRKRLTPNLGPVFCRLFEKQLRATSNLHGHTGKSHDLDVILCSTRSAKQYTENVLDALGIDGYVVLGRHLSDWKHIYKIQLVLDHIARHPEPEILLHLDATDVLVIGDLKVAVDTFLNAHTCDLLFGAEKGSAPGSSTAGGITDVEKRFIERIEDFERGTYASPFRHLNAGCFIGRKQAITELFTEALHTRASWPLTTVLRNGNHLAEDDQLILRELHRMHHPRLQIDDQNTIFQNLFAIKRSELAVGHKVPRGPAFFAELIKHFVLLVANRVRRRNQARQ